MTLNGGEYNGAAQSAVITLECDESQSRSVSNISQKKRKSEKAYCMIFFLGKSSVTRDCQL